MTHIITFQNTQMDIIDHFGQRWLRGSQIGGALEYLNPEKSIQKLYRSNKEEFTPEMTTVIELPSDGGPQSTRIFSPRGTWLLAMFAKTKIAMEFRRWVLDVLEGKEGGLHQPISIPAEEYIDLLKMKAEHVAMTAKKRRRLTDAEKQAILDLHKQGFGYGTIGKKVGRPADTVQSYLRRVRREINHV